MYIRIMMHILAIITAIIECVLAWIHLLSIAKKKALIFIIAFFVIAQHFLHARPMCM